MTVFIHEIRRSKLTVFVWGGIISFMLLISVIMFPQMASQADTINEMYANMGEFTEAFGMDQLNMADPMGYYGIECGNVLGIGGALFAAIVGISALSKEQKEKTAEFLLSAPVSRRRVVAEKLVAAFAQIIAVNLLAVIASIASFAIIGEELEWQNFLLLHLSYLIMQLEVASICFCISAFLKSGGLGIGMGIAAVMYFLNIIKNIAQQAVFLKFITPFSYTDASDVFTDSSIDLPLIGLGIFYSVVAILLAFYHYEKKDIVL